MRESRSFAHLVLYQSISSNAYVKQILCLPFFAVFIGTFTHSIDAFFIILLIDFFLTDIIKLLSSLIEVLTYCMHLFFGSIVIR